MTDMVSQAREHHHNELQFAQAKAQRNEDLIHAARRKKDETMKMMRGRQEFMKAMKRVVDTSYVVWSVGWDEGTAADGCHRP